MPYSKYRGRCVGRVMHFLFETNTMFDYWAKFGFGDGGNEIENESGNLIGTFGWEGETDYPIIHFAGVYYDKYQEKFERIKSQIKETENHLHKNGIREPWIESIEEAKEETRRRQFSKFISGLGLGHTHI